MKTKNRFLEYIFGINKVCIRSLMLTFILGSVAMLGVAIMILCDIANGINVIESEVASIMIYIFRSVCFAEFFLLLFDYAARTA